MNHNSLRLSSLQNRDFFNVDARDARRQEEQRMKKEKQDEEEKRKQDEEEKRKEKEDQQSQSLFSIHEAIGKTEQITGHTMRRQNAIGFTYKKRQS